MNLFLSILHGLIGACWLGSIFYSATILNPKTPHLLEGDRAEDFLLKITHGNRRRIIASYCAVLVTGIALLFGKQEHWGNQDWIWINAIKVGFSILYIAVFSYVSWYVYPWRVFASREELPLYRRKNTQLRWMMFLCVAINFILGVICHHVY